MPLVSQFLRCILCNNGAEPSSREAKCSGFYSDAECLQLLLIPSNDWFYSVTRTDTCFIFPVFAPFLLALLNIFSHVRVLLSFLNFLFTLLFPYKTSDCVFKLWSDPFPSQFNKSRNRHLHGYNFSIDNGMTGMRK